MVSDVTYDEYRWKLLLGLRRRAQEIMEALKLEDLHSIVYGSIARGDVWEGSDIDVFIPYVVASHVVEFALEKSGLSYVRREIVQATPSYVVKGYIFLDEKTTASFPLVDMKKEESEFYDLAGRIDLEELKKGARKPGMNKQLQVIVPTEFGHMHFPAGKNIDLAVKTLSVSPETLLARIRILRRRKEHGKTGVYRSIVLREGETFEQALKFMVDRNPSLRRRLKAMERL